MSGLPPVEVLALSGIGFVSAWSVWQLKVAPRLARRRATLTA